MNPASIDLKDMIVSAGYGTFGTNLFVSMMPETPDLCIGLFDIAGGSTDVHVDWQRPAVQVRVRGSKGGYLAAYTKIESITNSLHGKQETRNGATYKLIRQEGDIAHITTDGLNRPILTTRFQCQRTTTT